MSVPLFATVYQPILMLRLSDSSSLTYRGIRVVTEFSRGFGVDQDASYGREIRRVAYGGGRQAVWCRSFIWAASRSAALTDTS